MPSQKLLASVLVVLVAIPSATPFYKSLLECMDRLGCTEGDLVDFLLTSEASQTVKCTFMCHANEYNFLEPDGRIIIPKVIAKVPEVAHPLGKKCGNYANEAPAGVDPCEISYRFHKCLLETDRQLYYFIEEVED